MAAEISSSTLSSSPTDVGGHYWLARAGCGLLCGAAVAVLDYLYYLPLASPPSALGLASFVALLVAYGGEGILLGLVVALAERRTSPRDMKAWQLALAVTAGVVFGVMLWQAFTHFVLRDQFGVRLFIDHVGQPAAWAGVVLYQSWLMLFFGGLAAAVYASQRRRTRMLDALRSADMARARSEGALAQVRLRSLQTRVDPELVFQSLAKLEALYGSDPAAAEHLLEELVTFLRAAVADIRTSAMTEKLLATPP
jgi:hypothetical protein